MRKSLFIRLLPALAVFSNGIQSQEITSFFGKQLKQNVKDQSKEITELTPNTLFLSAPEIKLFAGYSLNFLRTKCPQVNSTRIFELQKFVTKRSVGKIHEVSEKKTAFHDLLKSLRACTSRLSQRSLPRFRDWGQILEDLLTDIITEARSAIEKSQMKEKIQLIYSALMEQFSKLKRLLNGKPEKIPEEAVKKFAPATQPASEDLDGRRKREQGQQRSVAVEGEAAFRVFLQDILGLYGKTCRPSHKLNLFFKAASEDLFNYLTVDRYMTAKAAAYYLPSEFLENVTNCAL